MALSRTCHTCNTTTDPYHKPALSCLTCSKIIHLECLKNHLPPSFSGDVFFQLTCASCNTTKLPADSTSTQHRVIRDKMPWLNVLVLTLYHLRTKSTGISNRGYFHWKSHITTFIDKHWDHLFQKTVKRKKNWIGTISGTLSHYTGTFFLSGTNQLGESGWWKLLDDNDPPQILIAKNLTKQTNYMMEPPIYSHAYVQPTETLSHFLFQDQDPPPIHCLHHDDYHLFTTTDHLFTTTDHLFTTDHLLYSPTPLPLPSSLFNQTKSRQYPWSKLYQDLTSSKSSPPPPMTRHEEIYLLQRVQTVQTVQKLHHTTCAIRRFYRKLALRKIKREYALPFLNIDSFPSNFPSNSDNRILDRFFRHHQITLPLEQRLLQGTTPSTTTSLHSPYTNRLLKPFIRRDTLTFPLKPLWLRTMEELSTRANRHNPLWKPTTSASIDYSYIRPQHIPAINSLCSQFFWPGIDLAECLQYPDFTCVVLYKKLVIAFAILVPDVSYNEAYISFFLTRPEWRKSGIGTFMLYHLIQTCMGRDVTLHVSVTNPALILYQKFGFKVQEFIQDFYDKYMPPNSRECRHALFLRLSR